MSIKITTNRQNGLRVTTQPGSRILINTGGGGGGADEASGKFKIEELPVVNGGTF
mgnify:CR=1 FL=1